MSAADELLRVRKQLGGFISAGKISHPLARALYWKQARWEAEQRIEDIGNDLEYRHLLEEERETFRVVNARYRQSILDAWSNRFLARGGRAA